jgi:hypothetical protein
MSQAGAQMMNWFAVACELQGDWRNDMEGLNAVVQPSTQLPQLDDQLFQAPGSNEKIVFCQNHSWEALR